MAAGMAACGETLPPEGLRPPQVLAIEDEPGSDCVLLTAEVERAAQVSTGGFYLWRGSGKRIRRTGVISGGLLRCSVSGLEPSTSYSCMAFISNGEVEILSQLYSFTTLAIPFTIDISSEAHVSGTTVMLGATLSANGPIESCGFLLRESGSEVWEQFACELDNGRISYEISGLNPDTEYAYAVYYLHGGERVEGPARYFRTDAVQPPEPPEPPETPDLPELSGMDVSADMNEAILMAQISDIENMTACGFLLWDEGGGKTPVPVIPENGRLVYRWEGLAPGKDYRFSAYCENGETRSESTSVRFRTRTQPYEPSILQHLLAQYDTNGDGLMSQFELARITELSLSDILLESQAGLESLPNLEFLYMGNNWLGRIDISVCPKLKFFSGGRSPHWEQLYIDNPDLWQLYIIESRNLTTIDLSRCPHLAVCSFWNDGLESLDFSNNLELHSLSFGETNLTELDLSANWRLNNLQSVNNEKLEVIWLKKGIILEHLEVDPHTEIKYK